jgi:predicted PilT family ATPase
MAANTFDKFKFFSSTDPKDLEEKINRFLDENSGHIKIMKRTMTVVSWGKPGTWKPVIQMILGYRMQKKEFRETARIFSFDKDSAEQTSKKYCEEIEFAGAEITDLLLSSYIPNTQYSSSTCVMAIFFKG